MIIGNNFFISEMPKTGTTFLRNYFDKFDQVHLTTHHDGIDDNKHYKLLNKKYRICTIRSPYTWYLSFWKWSCIQKKKSPLYSDITSRRLKLKRLKISKNLFSYIYSQINKNINNLETLFSDSNSKKKFNKFLSIMLDTKYKNLVSSDFSFTTYKELGYMTYYFLIHNVSFENYKILFETKKKFNKIIKMIDKKIITNHYLKTESLTSDLKKFLHNNNFKLKSFKNIEKNITKSKYDKNYFNFFTKKNLLLIEKKENYLFEKFNYKKISKK